MDDWRIELLDPTHDRSGFRCGKPSLDEFLRSLVSQYEKRRLGRTYVAVLPNDRRVYGYYTLAAGSALIQHLPPKAARKLPKHPVPVALLGRLAVDQAAQGRGLGARLLIDALRRCLDAVLESLGHLRRGGVGHRRGRQETSAEVWFYAPPLDSDLHLYLPLKAFVEDMAAQADRGPNPPA